jgi:hypothetical protein
MEGASRVQRRRVTSRWRRTGCVLQVLRRAVEVLRQAVSTAPETGVETGKHFLSLSVNTNVSTASQRRTNTSAKTVSLFVRAVVAAGELPACARWRIINSIASTLHVDTKRRRDVLHRRVPEYVYNFVG